MKSYGLITLGIESTVLQKSNSSVLPFIYVEGWRKADVFISEKITENFELRP